MKRNGELRIWLRILLNFRVFTMTDTIAIPEPLDGLEVSYAQVDLPKLKPRVGVLQNLEQRKILIVAIAVIVGFGARVYRLDAAGFAEDEANKIFAIRCYEQGDFTAN